MAKSEQVIKDLDRVIGLINTDMKDIPAEEKKQMVADTIDHFDNYVSPGWLKYRKSVSSDSEQGAVLEWQDEGAYCYGLNGEKFIDCLGGFGIYTCGHSWIIRRSILRSFLIPFVDIWQKLLQISLLVTCSTASSQTAVQRLLRWL